MSIHASWLVKYCKMINPQKHRVLIKRMFFYKYQTKASFTLRHLFRFFALKWIK